MAFDKQAMKERLKDGFSVAKEKASVLADDAMDKAKVGMEKAKEVAKEGSEKLNDAKNDLDKRIYNPIDGETLLSDEFNAPSLIRLMDTNPYIAKEACKEAVGFNSLIAKNKVLELIKGEYPGDKFDFYPNLSEPIYLRNPYVNNMYISLNAYFDYIKKARVAELEMIANKLGAKYVKITYKESEKRFVSAVADNQKKGIFTVEKKTGNITEKQTVEVEHNALKEVEVASEYTSPGRDVPVRPELTYFKGELDIESLIEMRMGDNPPTSKLFTIKYNRKSDLSIDAAAGIDAVLAKLKMGASASVKSEVERENRLYLEYEIKF